MQINLYTRIWYSSSWFCKKLFFLTKSKVWILEVSMNGIYYSFNNFSSLFIYNWAETDRALLGQLRRVIKKHGGQTEAKTSIFKGLLLNNGSTLGAVNSLMDFFFDAKETDTSGKDPYDQSRLQIKHDNWRDFAYRLPALINSNSRV